MRQRWLRIALIAVAANVWSPLVLGETFAEVTAGMEIKTGDNVLCIYKGTPVACHEATRGGKVYVIYYDENALPLAVLRTEDWTVIWVRPIGIST